MRPHGKAKLGFFPLPVPEGANPAKRLSLSGLANSWIVGNLPLSGYGKVARHPSTI